MKYSNYIGSANREIKWKDKTKKEKLDFVFVCIAILTFGTGFILNMKNLTKK